MEAVAWQLGQVEGLGGDGGQDGVALAEEGVESPAQAVVVEGLGGDAPQEVGPGVRSPGRDVDQGGGLAEAGGQQEAEDAAVGEGQLRVRGQVAVDDGGDVQSLQEGDKEGQGAEVTGLVLERGAVPGWSHDASAGDRVAEETERSPRSRRRIVGAGSRVRRWREKA